MARIFKSIGLAALGFALTGCVSLEKYTALKLERDQLNERVTQADASERAARAENDLLKQQIQAMTNGKGDFQGIITNLMAQNGNLEKQLATLNELYNKSLHQGGFGPLPVALTNELQAFAASNPDLVDFDAARGIVKFKSDVTFAKGDAELTPKAKEVITRFASILNSPVASGYELMIAGHTDSTPVNNPATIARGHKNNWYLSAHRAISVSSELISHKTNAQRIGVVGYADQRPAASNASESGMQQNRRVEVLILPTQVRTTALAAPAMNKDMPVTHAKKETLNKDTPVQPKKTEMNK